MEYEVLWGDGPLGLTLRPDLGEDMPPVVGRITRLDSAAALAQVAVGHMLVSINGIETAHQGYDRVVGMLQKIARPATLRFRVPRAMLPPSGANSSGFGSVPSLPMAPGFRSRSRDHSSSSRHRSADRDSSISTVSDPGVRSSTREQYTVVWTEGPLGMILQPDKDDCHVPCIRKITGKGVGTGMERASVGDILVAVNGQETKSLGFRSTISLLKTIRKPAVLKFKRMRRTLARTPSYRDPALPPTVAVASPVAVPTPFAADVGVYDIVWREGDLGLKLKPGRHDVPVLSKLTGKGNASGLQFASIGDELVSVNGSPVEGEAYQDTLRMLKHSPKPAVLRFRRVAARSSMATTVSSESSSSSGYSRHAMMNNRTSSSSTSSSAATARRVHEPVYADVALASERRTTADSVRKKKRKIPLEVAKEVVAASLGVDGSVALFAGLPIQMIQEGTPEAHLLRKEAKVCILGGRADRHLASTSTSTSATATGVPTGVPTAPSSNPNAAAKESLLRAEEEARMLQEALEKVKSQAKKYEEILGAQKREQLLASATINKSQEVVGRQNNMIAELSSVISGYRRESYTELEVLPLELDDKDHESLMSDLEGVLNIPVVVPVAKFCAECGATESESQLDLDDDGQYYCKDCWEKFLNTGSSMGVALPGLVAKDDNDDSAYATTPVVVDDEDENDAYAVAAVAAPARAPASPSQLPEPEAPPRSLARMKSENKALEEKNARLEAEKKLLEIKELRHSGTIPSPVDRQPSMTAVDRTKRDRRGMQEFARALREEEERARADGNMVLAKKLSAQIARIEADAGMSSTASTASSVDSTGGNDGESGGSSARNGQGPPSFARSSSGSHNSAPAVGLMKRGVSVDGTTMLASLNADAPVPYASPARPESPPPPAYDDVEPLLPAPVVFAAAKNDYDDVNSDEEADDHVEELSDQEEGGDSFLREVEDRNFALARQLDEAHSVVERARMSIMLSGSDDEASDDFGLSDEQISLFKKLTTQAEERASTVDRLHPEDDSDSDDDSDMDDNEDRDDEDEEEDDGVWI